jgi:hypothetical protein
MGSKRTYRMGKNEKGLLQKGKTGVVLPNNTALAPDKDPILHHIEFDATTTAVLTLMLFQI